MIRKVPKMKGFFTVGGFCGQVQTAYVLFSDETDYYEFMEEKVA